MKHTLTTNWIPGGKKSPRNKSLAPNSSSPQSHFTLLHSPAPLLCVHPVWKPFRPPSLSLSLSLSLSHFLSLCALYLFLPSFLPPSNFLPSFLPLSILSPLDCQGPGLQEQLVLVRSVRDALAGHGCGSLLGKGSENFCKWGEMTPLVSNLAPLVSGISVSAARRIASLL